MNEAASFRVIAALHETRNQNGKFTEKELEKKLHLDMKDRRQYHRLCASELGITHTLEG